MCVCYPLSDENSVQSSEGGEGEEFFFLVEACSGMDIGIKYIEKGVTPHSGDEGWAVLVWGSEGRSSEVRDVTHLSRTLSCCSPIEFR